MKLCIQHLVAAVLILLSAPSLAVQWTFIPSLQLKETYTDNVAFTKSGEEDFITEVKPKITLRTDSRRLNANLGYTLQNLFYAGDSSRNARFHNLRASASSELIKNFGFLDLRASDSQRVISSSRGLALDNLNTTNRTDITSLAVNPYIKQRFGGTADASVSYSYETLRYAQGASNAEIKAIDAGLRSGTSFRRMTWSINYSTKTTIRGTASDYSRESSTLQMRYRVSKKLGVLFRAGTERNDLATPQNRGYRNGSYYAAGISIAPHSTLRIDFLSGTRLNSVSVSWAPTLRSALNISWRDQKVGLNPGKVWQGSVRLSSRRATWGASYLEGTTSVQGLQSLGARFQQTRSTSLAQTKTADVQPRSDDLSSTAFQLSNELFLRKRAQINFDYKTTKSDINIILYGERRELLSINDSEKLRGGNISWRWRFGTRTDVMLRFRGLKNDYRASAGGGSGKFRSTDINFTRKMGRGVEGVIMARNTNQGGLVGVSGRSYAENRLSVSVKWVF